MYEEIREKAVKELEEKKERRKGIRMVGLVFGMVAIILLVVASQFSQPASFWIKFPILVLSLVYGVVYFSEYGLPFSNDTDELSEEEIEREMANIYRKSNLNKFSNSDIEEELELREIEELKDKYDGRQDYV